MPWRELMRLLHCYFRPDIKREHTNSMLVGQPQIDTRLNILRLLFASWSSVTETAPTIRLSREALLSGRDTIDPATVSFRGIHEALVFLACLFHPRNRFALNLF
jgi:hypothetical protein